MVRQFAVCASQIYTCIIYSMLCFSIIASFDMKIPVDGMFFINNQLVAISNTGKVAVWQSVQKHWQVMQIIVYALSRLYA